MPIPVTSDVSLDPFRESVEMEKTEVKKLRTTFSITYLLLRCYYLTCVFFTIAKTCTKKHKHELGSPVELS